MLSRTTQQQRIPYRDTSPRKHDHLAHMPHTISFSTTMTHLNNSSSHIHPQPSHLHTPTHTHRLSLIIPDMPLRIRANTLTQHRLDSRLTYSCHLSWISDINEIPLATSVAAFISIPADYMTHAADTNSL